MLRSPDFSGDVTSLPTDEPLHVKTAIAGALEIIKARRAAAADGEAIATSSGATRRELITTLYESGRDTTYLVDAIAISDADNRQKELAAVMVLRASRQREAAGEIY